MVQCVDAKLVTIAIDEFDFVTIDSIAMCILIDEDATLVLSAQELESKTFKLFCYTLASSDSWLLTCMLTVASCWVISLEFNYPKIPPPHHPQKDETQSSKDCVLNIVFK